MDKKKYVHIGPQFPPLGGVSVHIYRHAKVLRKEGWDVDVVDYSKHNLFHKLWTIFTLMFFKNIDVIHLHGADIKSMIAIFVRPYSTKLKFTDHSGRWVSDLRGFKKFLFILILKKIDQLILVGKHIEQYYDSNKIKVPTQKMLIQNAFLAPPAEDEAEIWQTYTEETKSFIESHQPLIVANAFQLIFYNGVDMYGLDMCVKLIEYIKHTHPNVGLLFALADESKNEKYLEETKELIKAIGIQENFYFMTGQKQLWPIFKQSDLMIRPTSNDGYGISIDEALHFNCPVVASNVCQRNKKALLFKNRDIVDMFGKAEEVLSDA
ncbi:MAG: glycosyltransferase family 4 protein [Opitutaceae bacterium]|nr:glycosyltransferase family 4 protein [Opitutaceae bacterium]